MAPPYRQLVGAGDAGLGVHRFERRREASGPESARGSAASRHEPRGTGEEGAAGVSAWCHLDD